MSLTRSRRALLFALAGAVLVGGAAAGALLLRGPHRGGADDEAPMWVEVKRIRSGDTMIVSPDNKLTLAGVRAPIEGEPHFDEAVKFITAGVEGKKLRLRFEDQERDAKERLVAYAYEGKRLLNAEIVRAGLAYARITPQSQSHADELLAAQSAARKARRGLWADAPPAAEVGYWADTKYANFHRAACEERKKAKPERVVEFKSRSEALDRGMAPCADCRP